MGEIKFEEAFVCHQAYIHCPFGEFIQPVEATVNKTATFQGKRVLTKDDDVVGRNIHPFKKCDKNGGECELKGTISWQKARTDIKINGSRILTGESYFMCPYQRGVKIEFKDIKQAAGDEIPKNRTKLEVLRDEVLGLISFNGRNGMEEGISTANFFGMRNESYEAFLDSHSYSWESEEVMKVSKRYKNIKDAIRKDIKYTAKDTFRNWEAMWRDSLPALFIHGDPYVYAKDDLPGYIEKNGLLKLEEGEKDYENVTSHILGSIILDVIHPAYGMAEDAYDFSQAYKEGDTLGMAFSAIGFLPLLGAAKKPLKKGLGKVGEVAGNSKVLKKGAKIGNTIVDNKVMKLFRNTLAGHANKVARSFGKTLKDMTEATLNLGKRFVSSTSALKTKYMEKMCDLSSKGCFVEGTLVKTENGLIPIEEIQIGDYVYTYDEKYNEIVLKEVVNTMRKEVEKIISIKINKDVIIETTENHPFYVENTGWVEAKQLREGDKLLNYNEEYLEIEEIEEIYYFEKLVYNLQLDENHNFFVSDLWILVHNSNWCKQMMKTIKEDVDKAIKAGKLDEFIEKMWTKKPTFRGTALEKVLAETEYKHLYNIGEEWNGFYPLIDFVDGSAGISVKTLDPRLASHAGNRGWKQVTEYVDDYVKRTPYNWNKETKEFTELTEKILDIRIPKGTGSMMDIDDMIDYAEKNGIILMIEEM